MVKKYVRLSDNLDSDYHYYLAQKNIYTVLFGHKPKGYKKSNYIWQALLKQFYVDGKKI